ncbi:hypothetical protein [Micromonospora endophytica]|nr:hypothetical protein [Micromonospora endophytica]
MTTSMSAAGAASHLPLGERTAKALVFGQALIVGGYFLLAVIPYFAYGLNGAGADSGPHDPKDLFPMKYTTTFLPLVGATLGPFIAGVLGLGGLGLLAARRAALSPWLRAALLICAAGSAALIAVNVLEVGDGIRAWVLD